MNNAISNYGSIVIHSVEDTIRIGLVPTSPNMALVARPTVPDLGTTEHHQSNGVGAPPGVQMSISRTPGAMLTPSAANAFHPFMSTHGDVIGGTKFESQVVAWALTAAAYATQVEYQQVLMSASNSLQLRRDSRLANRIYSELKARSKTDVHVEEIETMYGFKWTEIDVVPPGAPIGAAPRRLDPLFAQHITAAISTSWHTLLFSLPMRLAALPGLADNQSIESLTPGLNHACNYLYITLGPILTGAVPGATHETLMLKANECAAELVRLHTEPQRALITRQLSGLLALQRICAAAQSGEPIRELLFQKEELLQSLATQPPHQFIDELERERIPFSELADFLITGPRRGVRGAASLPPSGAVQELAVYKWAQDYGEATLRCLVPVRIALNQLAAANDIHNAWHGVMVADRSAPLVNLATQTGGPTAVVPCTTASHTHCLSNLMLVAIATSNPVALLVPRLVSVVVQLIEAKHISVRTLKSELLLSLVRRWDSESTVERDCISAAQLEPAAEDADHPYPVDDADSDDPMDVTNPGDAGDVVSVPEAVPSSIPPMPDASVTNFGPRISTGSVPLSLERDYAIVTCTRDLLLERGAASAGSNTLYVLSVKAVVARVMARAYHSLKSSERSTSQSVGVVFTKLAQKYDDEAGIGYWKVDQQWFHDQTMPKPKSAGLVLTAQGYGTALEQMNWTLEQMRINGTIFAKTWFPSRSARSHSRRSLWQRRNGSREDGGDAVVS